VYTQEPKQATIAVSFPEWEVKKTVRWLDTLVKGRRRIVKEALNILRLEG